MDGTKRANINVGDLVHIVLKENQRNGQLTEGVVSRHLTNSPNHPHGIKDMLTDGQVGRVKNVIKKQED